MKKKIIVLLIALYLVLIPFSSAFSGTTQINNSTQFFNWLDSTGTPAYSVSGCYRADYETYRNYGLIVYGNPSDIIGNEYKDGEYRFLGYTFLESKYTNQLFPDDFDFGNLPENWDYIDVPGSAESWELLEQSVQKPYMLYTKLLGHGATTLTAADIGITRARVQSPATWMNSGSIYTYKSNDYYATFSVPAMGMGILSASLIPDFTDITVSSSYGDTEINLKLNASVNKPKDEVSYIKVIFHLPNGDVGRFFHNTNAISIDQSADIPIPENLPETIQITATVTTESIFGDKLEKNVSCTVKIKKGEAEPTASSTPTPTPTNTSRPPVVTPTPTGTPVPTVTPAPSSSPDPEEYLPARSVQLWGDWNYWDSTPHRFLALEKIHLKVTFTGYVSKMIIRLSSDLEKMQYTNSDGYTYDYSSDFFGYYINFPEDSTISPDYSLWGLSNAEWEYIIPLCDETIGWDGTRKKPSYVMTITIYGKSGESQIIYIEDIDITGNTYELLHPQPVK